ncbi:MAG: NAD-dependent dihydropyrimidine dehydrogenase subunit PreT [Chloroflexi bacterium ADurb.Bin180]|nr:MAG: NAD-dependent dihydropyrimidine dehydrogenase subunit PreT [Chloroflexi bacterium ADurb.Bin180]
MEQHKLRELEAMCIQEAPPACTAACPLHVDVRGMILELRRGDLDAALRIVRKALPFPGIIGRTCAAPCTSACRRNEAGEALAIRALERACADLGRHSPPALLPSRGQRVAVVGGGPAGLVAAYDLRRKGYTVVLLEAEAHLGGRWRDLPERELPRSVLEGELSELEGLGVEVRLRSAVAGGGLDELRAEYDAVILAMGGLSNETFGLERTPDGRIRVDSVTCATSREGVFAAGSLVLGQGEGSAIQSMCDGRRAATTVDRFLQGASLTASRQGEGPYPSQLYVRTEGYAPLPVVAAADAQAGYTAEEARREAERCFPCACLECVKVCEYLAQYESYPRKYVREIYNNLSIVAGTRHSNQFINSCSLCGLCGEVCPNHLDMATVCREARETMVAQGRMPPSAHDFALRDMAWSNSSQFSLARHAPGTTSSEYVFFPGCQLCGSAPEQVRQMYGHLRERLGKVGLMLGCCGAPAEWAGRQDLLAEQVARLSAGHQSLGQPEVILACSTCYRLFKNHLPEARVRSLWEVLDEVGLPAGARAPQDKVALHDPCTTRQEPQMHQHVRHILQQLGCRVEELPLSREKTECCSFGGQMWLANRDLARAVVQRRIAASDTDYITYCAVCRDFFAAQGKPTLHLLDLLYGKDIAERAHRPAPGWSDRHENRVRLKRAMLKELWGEEMPDQPSYESIRLLISPEVRQRMEERLILVEDVQQVIEHAERSGARFQNRQSGHYLAGHKPAAVTYWVEYSPLPASGQDQEPQFVVHNAYSHRMTVESSQPG